MTWITPLENLPSGDSRVIGGKGAALCRLWANRFQIPKTLCITTEVYQDSIDHAGLREKIHLELSRKIFSQMRWEEIWDTSQRIRLLFFALAHAASHGFSDKPINISNFWRFGNGGRLFSTGPLDA